MVLCNRGNFFKASKKTVQRDSVFISVKMCSRFNPDLGWWLVSGQELETETSKASFSSIRRKIVTSEMPKMSPGCINYSFRHGKFVNGSLSGIGGSSPMGSVKSFNHYQTDIQTLQLSNSAVTTLTQL